MANNFLRSSFICGFIGLILEFGIIYVDAIECGTTDFTRSLILKGTKTERGEFPFLAALYLVEDQKFMCGGTLISHKHVLTAAHCVKDRGITLVPVDLIVLLGSYDLTSRIERGGVQRDVTEIRVHPDWKVYSGKYDADLAILVLEKMVAFTHFIRPVCIPADDFVVSGARGSIVGWGLTENGTQPHLTYPKHAFTNALSDSYCYTSDPLAATISSLRTFCGGGEATSPNRGDSGGGFFVRHGSAWAQYGVISALRTDATDRVDEHSIAIYTNVKEFKTWINDTVTQSGGEVGEAIGIKKIQIQLNCEYVYVKEFIYGGLYSCFVYDLDIRMENIEIVSFSGSHKDGKTDDDVENLEFRNGTIFDIPDGIGKNFKNLKVLHFVHSNDLSINTKSIRRSSFKNLKSLEYIYFAKNEIVTIEEVSLWDLPHLKEFRLNANKIESIPANLFKNNLMLRHISLQDNYLKTIDEVAFSNNLNLRIINLDTNHLESIPANLFENNLKLEVIWITNNRLKTIDVDFRAFQYLESIHLKNNVCIDKSYNKNYRFRFHLYTYFNDFLETIRVNCSSAKP